MVLASVAGAQDAVHTPKRGDPERKAILDALRKPVEAKLKQKVTFQIERDGFGYRLNVKGDWAFLQGLPLQANGKPIDYRKTPYQTNIDDGVFDDGIIALLRKKSGQWRVVTYSIGATDVPYVEWAAEHKAPEEIFK